VYRRKYVNVNESIFGPFSDGCLTKSTSTFPCFCNTGGRSFYMAQVNLTTGLLIGGVANDFLQDGALLSLTTSLDVCAMTASSVQQPLNVAMLFNSSSLGAVATESQRQFSLAVVSATVHANAEGGAAAAGRFNPILKQLTDSSVDLDALLFNLTVRSNPYVLLGGDVATRNSGIPSLFLNAVSMQAADPALMAATQYSHYELQLVPVLADYIHTLALFLTSADGLANGAGASVLVACAEDAATPSSTVLRDLVVKSLHTFQVRPALVVAVVGAAEAAAFAQSAVDRAAGGAATVVLFATLNATACAEFVTALAARATAGLTTAAQQAALKVLVAAPELALFVAKDAMAAQGLSLPGSTVVYFASAQQEWWTATSPIHAALSAYRKTTDPAVVEHPSSVRGLLATELIYGITREMASSGTLTAATLLNHIYTTG
ncbi:MAG: hypothetical protein Q8J97_10970, partial [Flavobacteriaceae bacterium]|nr:hypothetical protein [Flavobacteriaceae bacterium]